ncbi:MAG TPA: hypothetical protein VHM92_13770 [Allosphingosinicella sp.]|nr:hypothetical protein [Allosphingosinicella sp.]
MAHEPDEKTLEGELPRPHHFYLNYLMADEDADIHAYFFRLENSQTIQDAVEAAIDEIKRGKQPMRGSPDHIVWRRYSYNVFVLDDPSKKLTDVDFRYEGRSENHTFFERKELEDFGSYSGVYYLNIRHDRNGKPLGGDDHEKYRWYAYHVDRDTGHKAIDTHENSGTNTGP